MFLLVNRNFNSKVQYEAILHLFKESSTFQKVKNSLEMMTLNMLERTGEEELGISHH